MGRELVLRQEQLLLDRSMNILLRWQTA
jgi:hypothetical protein